MFASRRQSLRSHSSTRYISIHSNVFLILCITNRHSILTSTLSTLLAKLDSTQCNKFPHPFRNIANFGTIMPHLLHHIQSLLITLLCRPCTFLALLSPARGIMSPST